MRSKIRVTIDGTPYSGVLYDDQVAIQIAGQLPIEVDTSAWGNELYGALPFSPNLTGETKEVMEIGELAYWPPGNALCIFYGPTPASVEDEPRIASPGYPVGLIELPKRGEELRGLRSARVTVAWVG